MSDFQILDVNGKPLQTDYAGGGEVLPHVFTFGSILNQYSKTYSYKWDEALRHLPENALAMRRDAYIRSLLQERALPTVNRSWNIKVEDKKDPYQAAVGKSVKACVERTPRWRRLIRYLLEAGWYGRYGAQLRWRQVVVGGYQRWVCGWHRPVNGDKIQFQWDGTPGIQINASEASRYPADAVLGTDRFPILALNRSQWRQQFIIHSHEVDDADYYEGEMAGAVEGVGLRSQIYWAWWLRDEMLSWCVDFMRKVGTLGLLIFRYESGNKEAKAAAEANARTASQRVAITMPVVGGRDNGMTSGIEHIPANTGGVETLQDMIANYFERHMERLIVGQSMSSGGGGSGGLEGDGRANLAADTKWQLLKFDAENLAETLTTDLVKPIAKMNFPTLDFDIKFEFVIESPENEKKMQAVANACSLGVTFRMDDVRELTGMEAPDEGDETVGGQPQQQSPDTGDGAQDNEPTPYAGDEKWITIGGREEGDKKHAGGFPVQISSDGTILKGGPKGLRGKKVKDVKSHFSGNRQVRSDRTSEPESLGRGRPKQPEYGPGYNLPVSDLHIDPDRFQYKLNTDNDSGVTDKFKDTDKWDSTLAGIVAVWRDPKDGKDYVINGHHRFEMAKRFGAKELRVQYLNASDEQSARAQGALINIGEGNGTAIDAAKYLRDSNVTPEEMKAKGISLSGKVAADGIILSKLADPLFHRLTLGQLDEGRAKAIATHLGNDQQGQAELFNHIESEEDRRGSRLGNDVVERMSARWSAAPKVAGTPDLFGDTPEQSTFVDQAILESKLRGKLADDVRNFAAVKSDKRASAVAGAGNVLNTEKNKEEHQKAAEMLFAFDRLSVYKGEVSDILREEGANYATAKNKSERESITKRASERVRAALAGGSGPKVEVDTGTKGGGTDGGGQTPEGYQRGQADDPLTLYAFDANEPRDESGKWTSGGGSAPKPPEVDATKPHFLGTPASGKLKSLLALRHLVPPVVRRKVSAFVQKTYTKLETKYGPTGAKLVLGGMVALLPLPVPGSSVIPIAIAEGVKRIRRLFAGEKEALAMYEAIPEAMDAEMLAGAIREMLAAVYAEAGEDAPEVDDAKIIEVAAGLIDGDRPESQENYAFDPSEPRDESGKWTDGGSGSNPASPDQHVEEIPDGWAEKIGHATEAYHHALEHGPTFEHIQEIDAAARAGDVEKVRELHAKIHIAFDAHHAHTIDKLKKAGATGVELARVEKELAKAKRASSKRFAVAEKSAENLAKAKAEYAEAEASYEADFEELPEAPDNLDEITVENAPEGSLPEEPKYPGDWTGGLEPVSKWDLESPYEDDNPRPTIDDYVDDSDEAKAELADAVKEWDEGKAEYDADKKEYDEWHAKSDPYDAAIAEYEEAFEKWEASVDKTLEKLNAKAEKEHDKLHAAWEKESERIERRNEKRQERLNKADEKMDEATDDWEQSMVGQSEFEEGEWDGVTTAVDEVTSDIIRRHEEEPDEEEEADEDDELQNLVA